MRTSPNFKLIIPVFLWLAFCTLEAQAAIDNAGIFDNVLARYQSAASSWAGYITERASWLFWTLVIISMIWTFGMMALRKSDLGEFFSEFVRFTIFTGFFWWLLINGPKFASSIYDSLRTIGSTASGLSNTISPSSIVDIGFDIFFKVLDQSTIWAPLDSAVGILIATVILVIVALVGVNMLLLLTAGWILAYAGVFFLGFGGSRWTSDMAVNYYKTVLGVAAQLMTMVLVVGIGKTFLDDYYTQMSAGLSLKEMGVMMIVTIILLMLVNKVPGLISGVITGASIGHAGIGNFGAGAAVGAAGMAAAAAATGGAMIAAGATSAAGGAQAVMAAFSKAQENVSAGSDVLTSMWGGSSSSSAGGTDNGSNATSAFAQAAGFSTPSSGAGSKEQRSGNQNAKNKDSGGAGNKDSGSTGDKENQGAKKIGGSVSRDGEKNGSTTPAEPESFLGAVAHAATTAGKVAVDAGANLASGTATVAKEKAAAIREAAMERIADTTGGKIAAAIISGVENDRVSVETESIPTFNGNNLAGADSEATDIDSEVSAFMNRPRNGDSKPV